jgi:hypothetical protein
MDELSACVHRLPPSWTGSVVGSNDSLAPWTGQTAPTPEQTSEVLSRTSAAIANIRAAFDQAHQEHNRAVVLLMQADMFDPTVPNPSFADYYGFQPIVQTITQESAAFDGPVYLFDGNSHVDNAASPCHRVVLALVPTVS